MRLLRPLRIIKGEKSRIRRWIERRSERRLDIFTKDIESRRASVSSLARRHGSITESPLISKVGVVRSGTSELGYRRRYFIDKVSAENFVSNPPFPVINIKGPFYDTDRNEWYVMFKPSYESKPSIPSSSDFDELRSLINRLRVSMSVRDAMDLAAVVDRISSGKKTEMNNIAAALLDAVIEKKREDVISLCNDLRRIIEQSSLGGEIYEWEIYDPYTGKVIIEGIGEQAGKEALPYYRYMYGSHLELRRKGESDKKKI